MLLEVEEASRDEVFTDMVRIARDHRGSIENGTVVRIEHDGNRVFAIARGLQGRNKDAVIVMDEFVRRKLGVRARSKIDSNNIRKAKRWEKLTWYLEATNPAVHVPAWVAVISLGLGALSVLLGLVGAIIAICAA
ncbi:hypothetical protein [Nitratireductor rhodophyticola]|uniref:hypothetical protein n=1 Tax=Nitratireductor rhodophyticola TaxID=2854036 RepID=UPI003BABCE83